MAGVSQLPCLDFSQEALNQIQEGSDGWKCLSHNVREACESHGCFLVVYDQIPAKLREEMFMGMKPLFHLPEETKKKYTSSIHFNGYLPKSHRAPLLAGFGIDDPSKLDMAEDFTNLIETLHSMSSKMVELNSVIMKMIFESFDMPKHYELNSKNYSCSFRLMKYDAPPRDTDLIVAIPAHTDQNTLTILCEDEVQALEVFYENSWNQVAFPKESLLVLVGDALKAWSNGRLHASKHRVTMSKRKERYSYGFFGIPKPGTTVEVPQTFVNKEHPLRYRPFTFSDYVSFIASNRTDDALEVYAGI
ncbi:hypothetical protein RJ639_015598 [Escallonia herrerae]|uniref:2-oxoglutarate-dependent dioxygenase DAO n=1 Tax=Escallonia herrerae TaxID=1293975 RepID=A0AA88VCN2_9ASTE|nr:hypothetical protein RJ639_015598 [Escallonia herrerae]